MIIVIWIRSNARKLRQEIWLEIPRVTKDGIKSYPTIIFEGIIAPTSLSRLSSILVDVITLLHLVCINKNSQFLSVPTVDDCWSTLLWLLWLDVLVPERIPVVPRLYNERCRLSLLSCRPPPSRLLLYESSSSDDEGMVSFSLCETPYTNKFSLLKAKNIVKGIIDRAKLILLHSSHNPRMIQ
jgi:hypothetical protein